MVFYDPAYYNYALGGAAGLVGAGISTYKNRYMAPATTATVRGYNNRYAVGPRRKAGKRQSFATKVRSIAPYKHNTLSDSTNTSAMTHNTVYTTNLTSKIAQGDDNTARDGDAVFLTNAKIRGAYHSPATTSSTVVRILVGWSGEEHNVTASNAGLVSTEIFLPSSGGGLLSTAIVNPKAFTVLHDYVIDTNSLVAASTDVTSFAFNVPIKQKFLYQNTASVFGKVRNLYIVVIGSIIGGAGSVGTFLINSDVVFQNA